MNPFEPPKTQASDRATFIDDQDRPDPMAIVAMAIICVAIILSRMGF